MGGYHSGTGAVYWTEAANPIIGCHKVSEACLHCYAEAVCKRFNMNGDGTFEPKYKEKFKMPKKGVVFVCNMSDFMGEWMCDQEVEDIVKMCKSGSDKDRISLFLSKRHERYNTLPLFSSSANIDCAKTYFGVTAETQRRWDERKESIYGMKYRGFHTWVSVEPLLEPINLGLSKRDKAFLPDWIVVGSESSSERRRCDVEWIRSVVEQCRHARVKVFVKQIEKSDGSFSTNIADFPDDIQIREKPW